MHRSAKLFSTWKCPSSANTDKNGLPSEHSPPVSRELVEAEPIEIPATMSRSVRLPDDVLAQLLDQRQGYSARSIPMYLTLNVGVPETTPTPAGANELSPHPRPRTPAEDAAEAAPPPRNRQGDRAPAALGLWEDTPSEQRLRASLHRISTPP